MQCFSWTCIVPRKRKRIFPQISFLSDLLIFSWKEGGGVNTKTRIYIRPLQIDNRATGHSRVLSKIPFWNPKWGDFPFMCENMDFLLKKQKSPPNDNNFQHFYATLQCPVARLSIWIRCLFKGGNKYLYPIVLSKKWTSNFDKKNFVAMPQMKFVKKILITLDFQ